MNGRAGSHSATRRQRRTRSIEVSPHRYTDGRRADNETNKSQDCDACRIQGLDFRHLTELTSFARHNSNNNKNNNHRAASQHWERRWRPHDGSMADGWSSRGWRPFFLLEARDRRNNGNARPATDVR